MKKGLRYRLWLLRTWRRRRAEARARDAYFASVLASINRRAAESMARYAELDPEEPW